MRKTLRKKHGKNMENGISKNWRNSVIPHQTFISLQLKQIIACLLPIIPT